MSPASNAAGRSMHGRQLGRHLRHPVALPAGVTPHADAVDRYRLVQRPQPDQEAGVGERAARGADHRVEPDAERPGLRRHLLGGQDVTEPAERRMPGGGMDHVRAATLAGQRPGAPLQRCVGRRLVLAHGERMQRLAEQPVARRTVEGAGVVDALFELDVHVHAEADPRASSYSRASLLLKQVSVATRRACSHRAGLRDRWLQGGCLSIPDPVCGAGCGAADSSVDS